MFGFDSFNYSLWHDWTSFPLLRSKCILLKPYTNNIKISLKDFLRIYHKTMKPKF